ncbi:DUF2802 domain-containing protein [Aestuariirhabdus sp. Z084]|uniref:DUF2802 domain-containing protein n=1 Tax=Aestuariirhabdus haliotis TaxID=2918751 RepID=UPI00201B35D5|nr:DUF2802 domain-containing protein [Aestuariirhabdus haliotis]MCL6414489.1 DUF2802 domain-containing protein [Aestuariirhabdus haliotis]MCL6418529.1 DUF2802 domain-containing protein [Aestuariirhabdus haliotis]
MSEYNLLLMVFFPTVLVLIAFTILLFRKQKDAYREEIESANKRITLLESDLRAVGAGAIGVGQRLLQVEQRLGATIDKQEALEQRDPSAVSYTEAGKLFEMGASTREVMENCHISSAEAHLIELMHRKGKTNA